MTGKDQIRSKKRNTEIYLSTSKVLYSVEKKIIFFLYFTSISTSSDNSPKNKEG